MSDKEAIIRVKTTGNVNVLSKSIYNAYKESPERDINLSCIGAGAVNQAIKAVIVANRQFSLKGKVGKVTPYFADIVENEKDVTVTILRVSISNN